MSSLLDKMRAIAEAPAQGKPFPPKHRHVAAVSTDPDDIDDLTRILALPRRPLPSEAEMAAMARAMTARLKRDRPGPGQEGGCACAKLRPEVVKRGQNPCLTELRPIQGWYLSEAASVGGILGLLPVGSGKTGVDILLPMVIPDCKLAVLLLPPGLRTQLRHDYLCWSQHFLTPNLVGGPGPFYPGRPKLEIFAYSELSLPKNSAWFKSRPEMSVLICDEAHNLKDRKASRTHRFLKLFSEADRPLKLFVHSGSITTKSPGDYSHFSAIALGEGSPLPLSPGVVEEWAEELIPNEFYQGDGGKLKALCGPNENVRKGFHRRLVETSGVIATKEAGLDAKLKFYVRTPPPMPAAVREALDNVRAKEQRPDGEELVDAMEVAAVAKQVAAGFYLFWRYPHAAEADFEQGGLIDQWFNRRQEWNRELRDVLKHRKEHMDSPKLVRDAAIRGGEGYKGHLPTWRSDCWGPWTEIQDKVIPVTAVKWISHWLMEDAAAWGHEAPGIIWYSNAAVGHAIADSGKFPHYGGGPKAEVGIARELGTRTIVASIAAHGTGRNLQSFKRNLFTQQPSNASICEQALGRSHRPGQPAELVTADFYQHTKEYEDALTTAKDYSRYIFETWGSPQKLLLGEWD